MGVVIAWPGHLRLRCPPTCEGCQICEGGLFSCTRCGGGEGSLPSDCPGERMDYDLENAVYDGRMNFIRGYGWIELGDWNFRSRWEAALDPRPRH